MERDIVDDVNALLKLGVGDIYRLEHIKQAYMANKTIWDSDAKYMAHMKSKYLKPDADAPEDAKDAEDEEIIHCWKCGQKNSLKANFCMVCGVSLFEIDSKPETESKQTHRASRGIKSRLKKPILIAIPILILLAAGAAIATGSVDVGLPQFGSGGTVPVVVPDDPTVTHSKCGTGTVFDPVSNTCALAP